MIKAEWQIPISIRDKVWGYLVDPFKISQQLRLLCTKLIYSLWCQKKHRSNQSLSSHPLDQPSSWGPRILAACPHALQGLIPMSPYPTEPLFSSPPLKHSSIWKHTDTDLSGCWLSLHLHTLADLYMSYHLFSRSLRHLLSLLEGQGRHGKKHVALCPHPCFRSNCNSENC